MPGGASATLRMPMSRPAGPPSPTSSFASNSIASQTSPIVGHTRARSQTTAGFPSKETFDDRLQQQRGSGFPENVPVSSPTSTGSSYITAADLTLSRSPTSPSSISSVSTNASGSNGIGPGYALGRVPSIPLGTSYEQAQKRFNSGSWGQSGWSLGGLRNPSFSGKAYDEGGGGGGPGGMGGLLRRFSIGGSRAPEQRYSVGSASDAKNPASTFDTNASVPRSASPTSFGNQDLGSANQNRNFAPDTAQPIKTPSSPRGRQGSISGNTKRKPSPMGERLLMGHFNAH